MKSNKRGFLLAEETLKVILAVIAIGFLAYLLFSLYKAGKDSKELELAKESLNFLEQGINTNKAEVQIYNPKDWVILSWPYKNEGKIPKSCENLGWNSCICIVEDVGAAGKFSSTLPFGEDLQEKYRKNSDENGACMQNSKELIITEGSTQNIIVIDPPITLNVDYQNKIISKA